MIRAAIFSAVSSAKQAKDDKISLGLQQETCKAKAAELGATIIDNLIVPGKSRSIVLFEDACKNIEAYAKLRKLVEGKQIDLLIFYEKSRLGRTIALCETITAFCHSYSVAIYDCSAPPSSTDAQKQSRSAGDSLNGIVNSWRAQTDLRLRLDKFESAIRQRIKDGKLSLGQPPFGYEMKFKPDGTRYIVVNEDEAATVRKLFDLYLAGNGHIEIARELNGNGYRTRQPRYMGTRNKVRKSPIWTKSAIRNVLNMAWKYAGFTEIRKYNMREPGTHAAIISAETAQRIVNERAARKSAKRTVNSAYLFSRVCVCVECGRPMHIEMASHAHPTIRCRPCKKYVPFTTVYDAFVDWFSRLDDEEYRYSLVEPIDNTVSKEQELQNELDKLEVSRQRFNRAYGDSVMSYDDYKTEIERIKTKEKTLLDLRDNERHRAILHRDRETRLGQLQEIGEIGIAMLEHDDPAQANVWLREFFKVAIDEDGNAQVFLR